MSATHKYYWLKLKRDFFKRHDVKIIESQENGKDYLLFYLKLLVEAIDHEGSLRFSDTIPYDEKMLATITDTNIDVVRSACSAFSALGMMERMDDGTIFMAHVEKMIGSETSDAIRMREARGRAQIVAPQDKGEHCSKPFKNRSPELEKEIDKELEKEEKKADKPPRSPNFIKPTLSEVSEYCIERGGKVDAQKWLDYYESNGWKVGRNSMRDWRAAVRTWERNGFDRGNNGKRPGAPTPEHIIIPDFSRGRNARES